MHDKTLVLSALVFAGALAVNVPVIVAQVSGEAGKTQRDAEGGRPFVGGTERGTESQSETARDPQSVQRPPVQSPRNAEGGFPFGGTESTVQGYPRYSEDTKRLQQALKEKGHDPGEIDGVMGRRTQQALRDYQRANNLSASGRLDRATAEALGIGSGQAVAGQRDAEGGFPFGGTSSTVQGYEPSRERQADQAREIQQALKQQGHNPGAIDGVIGAQTRQAIRDFQQAQGLPATGIVDGATASALGLDSAGANAPSGSASPRS